MKKIVIVIATVLAVIGFGSAGAGAIKPVDQSVEVVFEVKTGAGPWVAIDGPVGGCSVISGTSYWSVACSRTNGYIYRARISCHGGTASQGAWVTQGFRSWAQCFGSSAVKGSGWREQQYGV